MNQTQAQKKVAKAIQESIRVKETLLATMVTLICELAQVISESIRSGGKLILFLGMEEAPEMHSISPQNWSGDLKWRENPAQRNIKAQRPSD